MKTCRIFFGWHVSYGLYLMLSEDYHFLPFNVFTSLVSQSEYFFFPMEGRLPRPRCQLWCVILVALPIKHLAPEVSTPPSYSIP